MKEKIYIYPGGVFNDFIQDLFPRFEILTLNEKDLNNLNFKNNNILFFKTDLHKKNNQSFFSNNNPITLLIKSEKISNTQKTLHPNFKGPLKVKKFIENINSIFFSKTIFFQDIKIMDENIINVESDLGSPITFLEKKILMEFIEHKQIKKEYFLEKIFEISKDAETKTIESHLTRIRKKLLLIKSNVQISSKENNYYIRH